MRRLPRKKTKKQQPSNGQTILPSADDVKISQSKWWHDPPKLIPILISLIALFVSALSWWESHQSRLINQEVNRPILYFDGVQHFMYENDPPNPALNNGIKVHFAATIQNSGKVTALINNASVAVESLKSQVDGCKILNNDENKVSGLEDTEIFSGDKGMYDGEVTISENCKNDPLIQFRIRINVTYSDAGTNRQYTASFLDYYDMSLRK